ncbi:MULTISPECIES: helix-turn-helix domain-containing protein [unclassified Lactobacillus]|uniref:helix-turn-helix domain-containing protein n=1 Tax=unclassified Lactobacillus TaxID=2620435 RepID=UPI000EFB4E30|nr:XRE family transcriptional regulator [Lactobacillus sp. ESL0247]RMC28599.1 XRE family transcriptional regulator [Lactobacillus sp. ESL0246]RMC31791.1 XRE family transcriptional regulator [Lactobacillus sp. ESL0245]
MIFNFKRLRAERVAKGLTQAEMAKRSGISRTSYWKKENGKSDIGVEEFTRMLTVLGYPENKISIFFTKSVDKREQKVDIVKERRKQHAGISNYAKSTSCD